MIIGRKIGLEFCKDVNSLFEAMWDNNQDLLLV